MLRATYSHKRCSRAGSISTRAFLSYTRPGGQKVVERVWEYKNTEKGYQDAEKREFIQRMKKIVPVEIVREDKTKIKTNYPYQPTL